MVLSVPKVFMILITGESKKKKKFDIDFNTLLVS